MHLKMETFRNCLARSHIINGYTPFEIIAQPPSEKILFPIMYIKCYPLQKERWNGITCMKIFRASRLQIAQQCSTTFVRALTSVCIRFGIVFIY